MSGTDSPPDDAQDALERLYDDPEARIADLQNVRPSDRDVAGQAAVFKALGSEDRLRVLEALRDSECCGCELQVVLDAPQSTVSTHLRPLSVSGGESRRSIVGHPGQPVTHSHSTPSHGVPRGHGGDRHFQAF